MERIKKQKSIAKIFAMYIATFCIITVLQIIIISFLFIIGLKNGMILPANYYEQMVEKNKNQIMVAEEVSEFIPEECNYVVYDLNGKIIISNVSEKNALKIWRVIEEDRISYGSNYYKIIPRENEVCAIGYKLTAQFSNPILRKYLPSAEWCPVILFIITFILGVIILSKCFSKRVSKEMKVLKDVTENIQMENLCFKTEESNIIEINEVLLALDKMKSELNNSLDKQWKLEESRKEQIAALAHDIKTPLTIIKGNSELLNELNLNSDQVIFNGNILGEVKNMEYYIKSLIEIMKSEKEVMLKKENVNLKIFINEIIEQGILLIKDKQIKLTNEVKTNIEIINVDRVSLKRAIINIITNAIDYCPIKGEILFSVDSNNEYISFTIEDNGRGFTKEELDSATEQFYQGDKSRNSKNHYGMGLYITRNIIKKHGGNLILENSKEMGGAKVVIKLPL
ncbi:HAMP domain-containing histidine kinase [Clostridium botulinum]|uniref:histidine kinase n=1 Tax=Clostridium botulinum TaxID=1491 RepID=A0A0M1LSS3_CLOBO|nr:HAMP domain-containing sensor histidine kinase [Clostridium botulinum]KAI3344349.1 HAMP domain-containing histidine kinase [Clostridium botulinum]KOM86803.1 lantibiotic biosynthesis protein [Clostridium botulinum]KOR60450.1 lantibiotic biosynthesis protein [Clostridium botulinum]MBN1048976.1 sensor histidine kinase [Clostridium botulinum]MBN1074543.1 sensor histidine kinase [Clostridium botulinum]